MHIKGITKDLYIKKQEISIINFFGKKTKIPYLSMKKIDFCYSKLSKAGYIDFILLSEKSTRFEFKENMNTSIKNAIIYISEHESNLPIKEYKIRNKNITSLKFNNPLTMDCVKVIVKRQVASIEMIERICQISFKSAIEIMDEIIEHGIVSKPDYPNKTKVLLSQKEFEYLLNETENGFQQVYIGEKDFDNMSGYEFEHFCATLLSKNNFENVEVTQGSGDQGIDIIAYKEGIKYGIQCKCYASDIGNSAIQEAFAGKTYYGCHIAAVLTNRNYTKSAIELADKNGVLLWNREKLYSYIQNIK